MAKSPAFQFYPADWLSSATITLMTPAEEGAYIRLLCFDWAQDGIIDDDDVLARLSRLNEGWFNQSSTTIKKCFQPHPEKPGYITNSRLVLERKKQLNWAKKSAMGGKKSAETRAKQAKSKGGSQMVQPKVNRPLQPMVNSMSSSSSMFISSNTPLPPKGNSVCVGFDKFWEAYPRKIAQGKAQAAWNELTPNNQLQATIQAAIKSQSQTEQWRRNVIPSPANWLTEKRWTDSTPHAKTTTQINQETQSPVSTEVQIMYKIHDKWPFISKNTIADHVTLLNNDPKKLATLEARLKATNPQTSWEEFKRHLPTPQIRTESKPAKQSHTQQAQDPTKK